MKSQNRIDLIHAFLLKNNLTNFQINKIAGDASFRSYFRATLNSKESYIIMDAPPQFEDIKPFCKIAEFLTKNDFSAPKILARDDENGFLLLEDFGDESYGRVLSKLNGQELAIQEKNLYQLAIKLLLVLNETPAPENLNLYNQELLLREVMLFMDWYVTNIAKKPIDAAQIADFKELWHELFNKLSPQKILVLRDYHADNLMILKDRQDYKKVGLLDFQDAVLGSPAYDLVSLLEDARRDINQGLQHNMLQYYLDNYTGSQKEFLHDYQILSLQRNIKIVGIFSRLSIRDKKDHYLNLLPRVFGYINSRLEDEIFGEMKKFLSKFMV